MSKVPVSIRMDEEVIERLRNAVWHLGRGMTVTSVVEESVERAILGLEKQNGGKPFSARVATPSKSRGGRPRKEK